MRRRGDDPGRLEPEIQPVTPDLEEYGFLHSEQNGEKYIPWADGRSPFSRATFEKVGFRVLAIDVDDNAAARAMGKTLGWGSDAELETSLFGIYTLVQRP